MMKLRDVDDRMDQAAVGQLELVRGATSALENLKGTKIAKS
jgi:hypothetical protein